MTRRALVSTFDELVARPFAGDVNALCWPRALAGDFEEVAALLAPADGLVEVDIAALRGLPLSAGGRAAVDVIVDDVARLDALGRDPVLNCIKRYARDERGLPIKTDVLSFHADSAPVEGDTWLCTYAGKSSEGLDNDDAVRLIDEPGVRAALASALGDIDDAALREGAFDQHYRAREGARPFSFGVGNLWRIAVDWPGSPVLPCLHRAPAPEPGDAPRLLLIC